MFDASSKVDPGAFDGNIQSFGSFDSCIKINTKHNFMGKMCVVEIVGIQALDIVKDQVQLILYGGILKRVILW